MQRRGPFLPQQRMPIGPVELGPLVKLGALANPAAPYSEDADIGVSGPQ